MSNLIVFCQESSNNKFPKSVTGIVDFGKETYTVFTKEQKVKIVESLLRLEDCQANAISDSIIISKFQAKEKIDSAALSLCVQERDKRSEMYDLCMLAVKNKQEELDRKQIELQDMQRKEKRQRLFKKIGAGVGTGLGAALGVVAGYFGAKLGQKIGQ